MEIHVYLTGRLGNQLFQYAFARKLQKQYGGNIICNIYELEHRSEKMKHIPYKFAYDMSNYKLDENVQLEDVKLPWYADFYNPIIRVVKKIAPKVYFKIMSRKGYLMWQRNDYIDIPQMSGDRITINGWWQDFRFFHDVERELSDEIVPITDCLEKNRDMYETAQNTESVCLSIRGGNYLAAKVKELLFVCDRQYFYDAIVAAGERINNPVFLVFSDDLDWVKEYIRLEERFPDYKFLYETGTDSVEEKLRMMTMCKHFIISNSSFSWWAQYLAKNKNKVVIAPDAWFTNGKKSGLYMDTWKLVSVTRNAQEN